MEFSKRNIIFESWQMLKGHLGLWILIMLFVFAFNIAISTVQEQLLNDITTQTILFIIAAYLFQAGINLGILKIALNIHNDTETGFSHVLGSFHLLVTYIIASIIVLFILIITAAPGVILLLVSVSTDLGSLSNLESLDRLSFILPLLLIIVPVAYASIRLQFYDFYLVDEEYGIISSIKRSLATTSGYAGELFIMGAILSIIILISMIPIMLGLLISIPLATMVNTHIYLKLKNPTLNE